LISEDLWFLPPIRILPFKIKENGELVNDGYVRLNTEGYGGMLCWPWMDRPLSAAGRLVVKEDGKLVTKLVKVNRDLLMIPSLAIHMNRKANEEHTFDRVNEMAPVFGMESDKGKFMDIVAEAAGVKKEDVLGADLYLYIRETGKIWGADNEFLSAGHLDDLQCAFGCMTGFLESSDSESVPVLAVFDNEEVGSLTKQGAESTFLKDVISRILDLSHKDEEQKRMVIADSFMMSADNAHSVHPSFPDKADQNNRPKINGGVVLKYSAAQKYTTDGVSAAVVKEIAEMADVPVQVFTNRSDMPGGSTLGNLSNRQVSLNAADIGLAQWAMHSAYETAGTKDTEYLVKLMKQYYSLSFVNEGNGVFSLKPQPRTPRP